MRCRGAVKFHLPYVLRTSTRNVSRVSGTYFLRKKQILCQRLSEYNSMGLCERGGVHNLMLRVNYAAHLETQPAASQYLSAAKTQTSHCEVFQMTTSTVLYVSKSAYARRKIPTATRLGSQNRIHSKILKSPPPYLHRVF